MNSTSRYALLAALGLAIAAVAPASPAFAKKKEEAAAPKEAPYKIDAAFGPALMKIDALAAKKDTAGVDAAIAALRPSAKTPDEKYLLATKIFAAAQASGDQAKISTALDELIDTSVAANRMAAEQKALFYFFQGQFAYQAKNYAKAEASLKIAIDAGTVEPNAPLMLADVQNKAGRPADGFATVNKAIEAKVAAGQPVPTDWYPYAIDMSIGANQIPQFVKLSSQWLAAVPAKDSWAKMLNNYRAVSRLEAGPDLDLLRLARAAGVLQFMSEREYNDYINAVYRAYPNEAASVIKEGVAAGKIKLATNKDARELLPISEGKIAADKASLGAAATAAGGPKATYTSVMATADVFYGYKDFAKAAEFYKLALTKPSANTNVTNLRLGASLAQGGDKAGAMAALNSVTTGPYADIATYWKTWIEHPAAS